MPPDEAFFFYKKKGKYLINKINQQQRKKNVTTRIYYYITQYFNINSFSGEERHRHYVSLQVSFVQHFFDYYQGEP